MNRYTNILTNKPQPRNKKIMSESDRDPRPDLRDDHMLWASVLITAHKMQNVYGDGISDAADLDRLCVDIFSLLHGLRCGGARLERLENGNLKLNYEPLLKENGGVWDKEILLKRWLTPYRVPMVKVFRKAAG